MKKDERRKIIVIDFDGTLCDATHRENYAINREWDEFNKRLKDDKPVDGVDDLIQAFYSLGGQYECIGLTGRNERWRAETEWWLEKHSISIDTVLMRPDSNFESDAVIKPKLLEEYLIAEGIQKEDVLFILEDRDRVVEAWRNLGYRCWQVKAGSY